MTNYNYDKKQTNKKAMDNSKAILILMVMADKTVLIICNKNRQK